MPIKKQGKNDAKARRSTPGWDQAILDAKARIMQLRNSIRVFEARKKAGDQWPDSATQN
jgi:hypothetical protein